MALPLIAAILFLLPPWVTVALMVAMVLAGWTEMEAMLGARSMVPLRVPGLLLTAGAFAEVLRPDWPAFWPAGLVLVLAATLARARDMATSVPAAAGTVLAAAYLGALGGTVAALRTIDPVTDGPWRVVLLLTIVMCADSFAYFTGSAFGRNKLAPLVSPGKTIEGSLGGLVGGIVGALAIRYLGLPGLPLLHTLALGVVVAALGTVGDLVESLFKRWAGVKDSGHLFPGHGGMLDRLDSVLFGAPVLYYYFLHVAR